MRVLLVGKGPPERGGIPAFLETIVASRLARDHDVAWLNLSDGEADGRGGSMGPANAARTLRDLAAVFRAARDRDVVHVHSAMAPGPTIVRAASLCAAARLAGARVLLHAHSGRVDEWLRPGLRPVLMRAAVRTAHAVAGVSSSMCDALGAALVGGAVDTDAFSPAARAPGDVPRVLFVGVLSPRKGAVDLIDASAELASRGVGHELVMAGGAPADDPGEERLVRGHADGSGAPVRLVGAVPRREMPALYRGADVFCLPSMREGLPMSVLEAMACGLPVVATPVGDVRRAVADGVSGALVPVGDRAALVDALGTLLTDAALRSSMGRAARETAVASFGMDVLAASLDALYRRLGAATPDGAAA